MNNSATGPTQRQLRVGEQLRHVIAQCLQRGGFDNEVLFNSAGTVTVSEVRVSPDLKHATAFVMSLGGSEMENILPALNDHAHVFQKEINRAVKMKFTPRLRFVRDDTFEKAARMDDLIRNLPRSTGEQ